MGVDVELICWGVAGVNGATELAVLNRFPGLTAGIDPDQGPIDAGHGGLGCAFAHFLALPLNGAIITVTTCAADATAAIVAALFTGAGTDAFVFGAGAVLAIILAVTLRGADALVVLTDKVIGALAATAPATVIAAGLVRTVGNAFALGTGAGLTVPALQAFTTTATAAVIAAILLVTKGQTEAVAAVTNVTRGAVTATAATAVGSAILVNALGLADDFLAEVIDALVVIGALTTQATAAVFATLLTVAGRDALAFLALSSLAEEAFLAGPTQPPAAIGTARFPRTVGQADAQSILACLIGAADATGAATGVGAALLGVARGYADA